MCGSGSLGCVSLDGGHVPGQQIGDPVDWVLGDAFKHGSEVVLRVEAVELGRADKRIDRRSALSSRVRRQFIMPEFWRAKSLSRTHFIRWPNRASSFSVNTSTMERYTYLFAVRMGKHIYFQAGWPLRRPVR